MKKPKMILFDFGETLITESFDPQKGNSVLYNFIKKNPDKVSLQVINDFAQELLNDIRKCSCCNADNVLEMHNFAFNRYLYEYFNIEFDISPYEMEQIFFEAGSDSKATPNIDKFLKYLKEKGVRTAVLSNMSFSENTLINWIKKDLEVNEFEFIITTSEYIFRKPSKRIFELALKKARLSSDEVWYCGNSSRFDIEGAYNSRIYPVWYKGAKWGDADFKPNYEFTEVFDWNNLIGIFD